MRLLVLNEGSPGSLIALSMRCGGVTRHPAQDRTRAARDRDYVELSWPVARMETVTVVTAARPSRAAASVAAGATAAAGLQIADCELQSVAAVSLAPPCDPQPEICNHTTGIRCRCKVRNRPRSDRTPARKRCCFVCRSRSCKRCRTSDRWRSFPLARRWS